MFGVCGCMGMCACLVEVKVSSVNVSSVLSDHKSKYEVKEYNDTKKKQKQTKLISTAVLSQSPSLFTSPELVLLATLYVRCKRHELLGSSDHL